MTPYETAAADHAKHAAYEPALINAVLAVAAETRAARTTYLPQPYPLWSAEVTRDGRIDVGRVVAWVTNLDRNPAELFSSELVPVVADDNDGETLAVRRTDDQVTRYFGDTRDDAVNAAGRAGGL